MLAPQKILQLALRDANVSPYIIKAEKCAESTFQSQKNCGKSAQISTLKFCDKSVEIIEKVPNAKNVAEEVSLKPRTCSLDIYGISLQHFDTYLKLLLFVTKFHRAKVIVFAFSEYNFAENSNNLWSPDFQDFHF